MTWEQQPDAASSKVPRDRSSPLISGAFGWFFVGRTVNIFGSSMTPVALSLSVLYRSGSAIDLGIVLASNMIPALVFMLLGGTLADRMSRRTLLIASSLASGLALAAMAGILASDTYSLAAMAGLSAIQGAVSSFSSPALRGIIPELVEGQQLQRANAALATSRSASRIIGPLVAGVLVGIVGGAFALAADAVSNLLAALFFTRLPATGPAPPTQSVFRDLVDGWQAFIGLRWVLIMSLSFALINALNVGPWQVLGPLAVSENDGAVGWGGVLSIRAVGLLIAGLALMRVVFRRPLTTGRLIGTLGALPLFALGITGGFWLIASAAFIGGIAMTVGNVTFDSTLQSKVPLDVLSRVSAFDELLAYLAIPLSQLAVGPAISVFGAQNVALFCGVGYVVASVAPVLVPTVRAVDAGSPSGNR